MIKSAGYRISPTEVEEIVYNLEGIAEVIAFGIPNDILGQSIFLAVSLKRSLTLTKEAIKQFCLKKMPAHMVPSEIKILDQMPHNLNGKPDRFLIKKMVYREKGLKADCKGNGG
jgi:acyl-coenzyme A synthetase/AMP-(fatty) acid ligase